MTILLITKKYFDEKFETYIIIIKNNFFSPIEFF